MSLKAKFIKIRNDYVINQVKRVKLPEFASSDIHRYRIVFSGRVQKVGFRFEMYELAKRLELTGFCKNLENGDVLSEVQGTDDRIKFLIDFMESLKRIKIKKKVIEELEVDGEEKMFEKRK